MSEAVDSSREIDSPKHRAVIEAATALFVAQGYGAVSMDAVARLAGVSKATLYAYFASKDRLFATIIGDRCQSKIATADYLIQADIDGIPSLRAALTSFGARMMRFLLEPDTLALYRVVVAEAARFPELGRTFYEGGPQQFLRFFAGWLTDQMRAGWLRDADAAVAAQQFIALVRGGLFMRASLGLPVESDDATLTEHAAGVTDMFLRAYAAIEGAA
jgi:TetR/AcrR family transcriptional repressor of mexJK operon